MQLDVTARRRSRGALAISALGLVKLQLSWPFLSHVHPRRSVQVSTQSHHSHLTRRRAASVKLGVAVLIPFLNCASAAESVCTEPGSSACSAGQALATDGMAAVVYSPQADGGMEFRENVPVPTISPEQILVKVRAAAINPVDYKKPMIPFASKILAPENSIVGIDVSGVIVDKGSQVSNLAIGDEVFGFSKGSLAEFAACDASRVAQKPAGMSHLLAASLPTATLTSYQALRDNGLKAGDRLLVLGASGGCGLAGVAIGKALGAKVTGVCSERNTGIVQSLGADRIVDYTKGAAAFEDLNTFDLVLDTVTGSGAASDPNYELTVRAKLKPGGMYVALNSGLSDWLRLIAAKATGWRRGLQRKDYDLVLTDQNTEDLYTVADWMVSGKLGRMPIDSVFNFTAPGIQQAFAKLQGRRTVGKLVIQVSDM
eukprot:TRINITY_DN82474_c0_g1_i1.p1 TRINITY_DN82474_c0_g1~~TRINITY_DN82474_c0_g1_i1.p1  ORF type:complete len:428 (+),score=74.60 TRINITY_DN82474_c0_g1_i1:10-1293(+)